MLSPHQGRFWIFWVAWPSFWPIEWGLFWRPYIFRLRSGHLTVRGQSTYHWQSQNVPACLHGIKPLPGWHNFWRPPGAVGIGLISCANAHVVELFFPWRYFSLKAASLMLLTTRIQISIVVQIAAGTVGERRLDTSHTVRHLSKDSPPLLA